MNLETYVKIIGKEIEVKYYHNQKRFTAKIKGAEIRDDGVLIGAYANGTTPEEAIEGYWERIKGETLVFNAHLENRQEFKVPEDI